MHLLFIQALQIEWFFFLNFIQERVRVHEQRVNVIQQIDAKARYPHVIRLLEWVIENSSGLRFGSCL